MCVGGGGPVIKKKDFFKFVALVKKIFDFRTKYKYLSVYMLNFIVCQQILGFMTGLLNICQELWLLVFAATLR